MNAYLIGPSLGYVEGNVQTFHQTAKALRRGEFEEVGYEPEADLRYQTLMMLSADVVVALDGWQADNNARFLGHVAQTCGLPLVGYPSLDPVG